MCQWVRDHKGVDNAKVISSFFATFMIWNGNVWEWGKVIGESPKGAEYPDVTFCMYRITDEERAARIIENGVEVINTVTA